jgi:hypothetical protein
VGLGLGTEGAMNALSEMIIAAVWMMICFRRSAAPCFLT